MYHGSRIDLGNPEEDSLFEFRFGFDPDLPQERVRHLAKKGLHQVEPQAMFGRVDVRETVRPTRQISARLLRDVRRVVVQDNSDRQLGRIIGVQIFEQRDKLPAPMSFLDSSHHMPVVQIQRSQICAITS